MYNDMTILSLSFPDSEDDYDYDVPEKSKSRVATAVLAFIADHPNYNQPS